MKKIIHICLTGGVFTDTFAYQENILTKYQKKLGYDVTVITGLYEQYEGKIRLTDKEEYTNSHGVHVIRLQMYNNQTYETSLKKYKNLYENLSKLYPDIIFIHGFQFRDILTIKKYIKNNRNVEVYIDNHADYSNSARTWLSKNILHKIVWRYCAKQIEPYTEKFYGVLPARVDILHELYDLPKEKCELLVMGADDELVEEASNCRKETRKQYGIEDTDFLIVTGGKIDEWKTQTILLEQAVNQINRENVKLLIFGSIIPKLKSQVLELCNENIKYIGWLSAEDSYKVIGAADLAVYPGRHSTLWEQTVGQGIPMVVKHWEGTHHVDVGGNVKFLYKDSCDEIYKILLNIIQNKLVYLDMFNGAQNDGKNMFSYKLIAERSIEKI